VVLALWYLFCLFVQYLSTISPESNKEINKMTTEVKIYSRSENVWQGREVYRHTKFGALSAIIILIMAVLFLVMIGLIAYQVYQTGNLPEFNLVNWLNSLPSLVDPNY